jgi:hypothetical protein
MHIDLDSLTQAQLKAELEKNLRLFDVAHRALLRISGPGRDAEALRKDAADTLAVINAYPDHPLFAARASK